MHFMTLCTKFMATIMRCYNERSNHSVGCHSNELCMEYQHYFDLLTGCLASRGYLSKCTVSTSVFTELAVE